MRNDLTDTILKNSARLMVAVLETEKERQSLENITERLFVYLVDELTATGASMSVIADLFGMPDRTFHDRIKRAQDLVGDINETLSGEVNTFVRERGSASRTEIESRFEDHPGRVVRSILKDLSDRGFLKKTGRGDDTSYEAVTDDNTSTTRAQQTLYVLAAVQSRAPVTLGELHSLGMDPDELESILHELLERKSITLDHQNRYRAVNVLGLGSKLAGVLAHHMAVTEALVRRTLLGPEKAREQQSRTLTFDFEVSEDHPHFDEVVGLQERYAEASFDLLDRVISHAKENPGCRATRHVTFYLGGYTVERRSDSPSAP